MYAQRNGCHVYWSSVDLIDAGASVWTFFYCEVLLYKFGFRWLLLVAR